MVTVVVLLTEGGGGEQVAHLARGHGVAMGDSWASGHLLLLLWITFEFGATFKNGIWSRILSLFLSPCWL